MVQPPTQQRRVSPHPEDTFDRSQPKRYQSQERGTLQHQVGCHNLLTTAVILWNSVYMAEALAQLEREGHDIDHRDLRHIWPTRSDHINVYGRNHFNPEEARQRDGL